MKQKLITVTLLSLLTLGLGLAADRQTTTEPVASSRTISEVRATVRLVGTQNSQTFEVELAITPEQQARGLSGRASLAKNSGMLFVFASPSQPAFWMKGMLFPLDIIWIRDGRVIDISRGLPVPATNTKAQDLPLYRPKELADYALEVNAGEAEQFRIGDIVEISDTASV